MRVDCFVTFTNTVIEVEYRMPDGRKHMGTNVEGKQGIVALLYADDLVLVCKNESALVECMKRIEEAMSRWGLTINVNKTKRIMINSDGEITEGLTIRGEEVEQVDKFVYLGSLVTLDSKSSAEIRRRLGLGAYRYQTLKTIWNEKAISAETKAQIYKATVMATMLYGAETWTCSQAELGKMSAFHKRRLLQLFEPRRIGLTEKGLFKKTKSAPMENFVRKFRLRWAGHVRQMEDTRLPKIVLFGDITEGKQKQGAPVKEWMKCLKKDFEKAGVVWSSWEREAKKREPWRKKISSLTSN